MPYTRFVAGDGDREGMYRELLERAPDGIAIVADGAVVYANRRLAEMTGRELHEVLGTPFLDYIAPEERAAVGDAYRRRIAGDRVPPAYEVHLICKDGSLLLVENTSSLATFEGRPTAMAFIRDVTERKAAANALRERDELVRALVETSQDWIWAIDLGGVHTYSNPAVQQILGYPAESLVGNSSLDLMHEDDRRRIEAALPQWIAEGRGWKNELIRWRHQDGNWRYLESTAVPIFSADGKLEGFRGVDRDVTERRRAEAERTRLVAAVDQADSAIAIADLERLVRYVNAAFERCTGYSTEDALGQHPFMLEGGPEDEVLIEMAWRDIHLGRGWHGTLVNQRRDGTLYRADTTYTPVRGEGGDVSHCVIAVRDVTREHELQTQLRRAQKLEAIGTLAGGIAHDFNNILAGITGFAELARDDAGGNREVVASIDEVLRAADRARQLVMKMSTFSRQREIERRPVRIRDVVQEALALLRASIPSTIEMRIELARDCGLVLAEPTSLQQIVMNLCTNAYHAMRGRPGWLEIALVPTDITAADAQRHIDLAPGRHIRLSVRDTGTGMDPDTIHRVFEPYFTTKEPGEGTGLGLAVVHSIVHQLGGAILVDSELGRGSSFAIYLPAWQAEAPKAAAPILSWEQLRGDERVLVVDDERAVRVAFEAGLARLGYCVAASADGPRALELVAADPTRFDVIVTDLTMPKMTGVELALQVRALRADLPVVLCTGSGERPSAAELGTAGIRIVAAKPLTRRELAHKVREALDGPA